MANLFIPTEPKECPAGTPGMAPAFVNMFILIPPPLSPGVMGCPPTPTGEGGTEPPTTPLSLAGAGPGPPAPAAIIAAC